jgi:hypothetical protein
MIIKGAPSWKRLMLSKEDVRRVWPFATAATTHSGMRGRPSAGHLIKAEHVARWGRQEALLPLVEEAAALSDWFVRQHPQLRHPTEKTIQDTIRAEHRAQKAKLEN